MKNSNYILCRPLGGLNDCLCQIDYCRRLSKVQNRTLIVQTETGNPSLPHRFSRPFEDVFYFNTRINYLSISKLRDVVQLHQDVFPSIYNHSSNNFSESLELMTNNVTRNHKLKLFKKYDESLIVHESDGGGLGSASILSNINLQKKYQEALAKVLKLIPKTTVGIHFRSSDYTSSLATLEKYYCD